MSSKEKERIEGRLKSIAKNAFLLTLPSQHELVAEDITNVIDQMSNTYADQLGIAASKIKAGHLKIVDECFS